MPAYITKKDLEDRLSPRRVADILDDANTGSASDDAIERLCADATAKVNGYLRGIYDLPLAEPVPEEVKRLTLDVAVAYAAQRHPEYVQRDWVTLIEAVDRELTALRKGFTRLDVVGPPEPGANQGATVSSGDVASPEARQVWQNMGDF